MQKESGQHAADIILRSSDKKLIYSWKTFLSFASPVFSDMFTLPLSQPRLDASGNVNECHDELPVIDLEEDSCTLDHILTLCHPPICTMKHFQIDSIHELRAVLTATTKYDMKNVRRMVLEELSKPSLLRQDPLTIYALACQYERREAALLAAKSTLSLPSLVHGYVPELEKIHAGMLCRLLLYREACSSAARSLAVDHTWIVYTDLPLLFGCSTSEIGEDSEWITIRNPPSRKYRSGREERKLVYKWWMEYMRQSEYVLERTPHGDAVKDQKLVEAALMAISTSKCDQCKASQISETFQSFVNIFAESIERRVAEVEINLGF